MTALERVLLVAGAALLGGLGAYVAGGDAVSEPASSIEQAEAPGGGWYHAIAGPRGPAGDAERTDCGLVLTSRSLGVSHASLPCGARLFLRFAGTTVLTTVIDHRLQELSRQFEVTPALARILELDGSQQIDWRFAVRSG